MKKVNEVKVHKRSSPSVSGPVCLSHVCVLMHQEYYGLANPAVMKLILQLPNSDKCGKLLVDLAMLEATKRSRIDRATLAAAAQRGPGGDENKGDDLALTPDGDESAEDALDSNAMDVQSMGL